MSQPEQLTRSARQRNLVAACAAIVVFGFAMGLMFPLLSLLLERQGYGDDVIGLNAGMSPIGILVFSAFIPLAARRFGARAVTLAAALASGVIFIGYKAMPSLEAWFVLRFIQGITVSTLFVLSESWIVTFADAGSRGRVVAIYAAALSASFGAGPLLIGLIGIEGWLPFVIGMAVLVAAMVPLAMVREPPQPDEAPGAASTLMAFARKAPMLLAAVGMFAIFDAATLSLIPVYGVRLGLDVKTAAYALSVLVMGNIVLQFPIGWLADRFDKRTVMAGLALATALLLLALPAAMGTALMWPVLFVAGATGYGIYTVALAALGERFSGRELVQGAAAFATMWGSGALIGAVLGGTMMNWFGPHGLPLSLAAALALFVAGTAIRVRMLAR
jgi:MFS family permease